MRNIKSIINLLSMAIILILGGCATPGEVVYGMSERAGAGAVDGAVLAMETQVKRMWLEFKVMVGGLAGAYALGKGGKALLGKQIKELTA